MDWLWSVKLWILDLLPLASIGGPLPNIKFNLLFYPKKILICYIFTVHAGLIYTYSTGMRQHLYVNQPELVKDMNQCITLALGKPYYVTKRLAPMLGNGILRSNGLIWAQQRKIVAPEFFMDKVKVVDQDLSIYVGFLPT